MPKCKNDSKRSYTGSEPSPKGLGYCAHAEKVGSKRNGLDGKLWIVKKTSKGSKRWVPFNSSTLDCKKFVRYEKRSKKSSKRTTTRFLHGLQERKGFLFKFIGLNTFEKKETKIPKGFKKVKIKKDWIKSYWCDPSRKLLTKSNEFYKKIPYKKSKKYFTHDNGGRPFLVYIGKSHVYIHKASDKFYTNPEFVTEPWAYIELVAKYKPSKVFIGKSIRNPMTEFSCGFGKKFDGNSILLQLKSNRYVFVGDNIYEFETPSNDKIIEYYSSVGNNDVPYPVGFGKKFAYFFGDQAYVPLDQIEDFKKMNPTIKSNLYGYFYGHEGPEALMKFSKKMKSIKSIKKRLF